MKLFLVAALTLLALSTAAKVPPPVCYVKSTKCCFAFKRCGVATKVIKKTKDCSTKVCKPHCAVVCKPHCLFIIKKVKVCKVIKYKKVCTIVPKKVKVCKKKCLKICKKKCILIKATCTIITTIKFPKYCAFLKCFPPKITGPTSKPAPFTGKHPISTHVSKPIKKIIGKVPIKH